MSIVLLPAQMALLNTAAAWGVKNPLHMTMVGVPLCNVRNFAEASHTRNLQTVNIATSSFLIVFAWKHVTGQNNAGTRNLLSSLLIGSGPSAVLEHARQLPGYAWLRAPLEREVSFAERIASRLLHSAAIFLGGNSVAFDDLPKPFWGGPWHQHSFVLSDDRSGNVSLGDFSDQELAGRLRAANLHLTHVADDLGVGVSTLSRRVSDATEGPLYEIRNGPEWRMGGKKKDPEISDQQIADLLLVNGFNLSQTARDLGVSKAHLSRRVSIATGTSPLVAIRENHRLRPGRKPSRR